MCMCRLIVVLRVTRGTERTHDREGATEESYLWVLMVSTLFR
jgi:hypothetical protein